MERFFSVYFLMLLFLLSACDPTTPEGRRHREEMQRQKHEQQRAILREKNQHEYEMKKKELEYERISDKESSAFWKSVLLIISVTGGIITIIYLFLSYKEKVNRANALKEASIADQQERTKRVKLLVDNLEKFSEEERKSFLSSIDTSTEPKKLN